MFRNQPLLRYSFLFILALAAALGVYVFLKIFLALGISFMLGLTTGAFFTSVYLLRKKKNGRFG